MSTIRVSQLDTATYVQGTDYLVVDNNATTKKTTLDTLLDSDAVRRATIDIVLDSDAIKALEAKYITSVDYSIVPSNIQIKGELAAIPSPIINIYIAVFVENTQGFNVGQGVIGSSSNKQGTIKSIDAVRKILYIKESIATANSDFTAGEYFGSTKIIKIDDFSKTLKSFQTLKIFYATINNHSSTRAQPIPPNGLAGYSITNGDVQTNPTEIYTYNIAQFRFDNGKISNLATTSSPVTCRNVLPHLLNDSTYNRLVFKRSSPNYGVLIYRQLGSEPMQLISVLGERELGPNSAQLVFNDIGGFATTPWSGEVKDTETGAIDNIYYFPLLASSLQDNPLYKDEGGFASNNRISSILNKNSIVLDSSLCSVSGAVLDIFIDSSICIDNTGEISGGFTKAAKDLASGNIGKINLPPGTYYTSSTRLSSYFNIEGEAKNLSIIKSLPCNFKGTYGNCIFNCENTNKVSIKNLTLDGNYGNNTGSSVFADDFLINGENASFLTLESLNIQNSVGGGVYAPESKNLRLIGNDVNRGCLDLLSDDKYTGLYAPQSEEILLNNNNFEDWLGPVDISATRTGVAANNIIKNCGSGLLVYGSTSLAIAPNVIVGIDGNSLPIVDIHEDNFDSININVEDGDVYTSDIISYLRDGKGAWLSSEDKIENEDVLDGTGVTLKTQIRTLVKLDNQEYLLSASQLNYSTYNNGTPTISIVSLEDDLERGLVQFRLTSAATNSLPTYGELSTAYESLSRPTGEKLVGLVYKITAEEYLFTYGPDKIYIDEYEFIDTGNGGRDLKMYPIVDSAHLVSALSVNDIIYPISVATGGTAFNKQELRIKSIGGGNDTPFIVCDITGIIVLDNINTLISTSNGGYIGVKNNFIISKGRINKS